MYTSRQAGRQAGSQPSKAKPLKTQQSNSREQVSKRSSDKASRKEMKGSSDKASKPASKRAKAPHNPSSLTP